MDQVFSDATRPNGPSLNQVKLPKFKLKTFSGNTVGWSTAAVDKNNTHLTRI